VTRRGSTWEYKTPIEIESSTSERMNDDICDMEGAGLANKTKVICCDRDGTRGCVL
jgi:hypothetical protein